MIKEYPVISRNIIYRRLITDEKKVVDLSSFENKRADLNEVADDVVSLCDGIHSIEDIAQILSLKYITSKDTIFQRIYGMLESLSQQGFIDINPESVLHENKRSIPSVKKIKYPLSGLFLECTLRCNLKCVHCYLGDIPGNTVDLGFDVIKDIIDQFAEIGGMALTISGGEPLLRNDIYDIISHAANKPLEVKLFTNGLLIDQTVAGKLKKAGISSVQVSIDGADPKTHDIYRGKVGSFSAAWSAVETLQNHDIKVTISSIVNKMNKEEPIELINKCKKIGLVPGFSRQISQGRANNIGKKWNISYAEYAMLNVKIDKYISEQINNKDFTIQKPSTQKANRYRCGAGINTLAIRSNGVITTCIDMDQPEAVIGNVLTDRLIDVWNSDHKFLTYLRRTRFNDVHICPQCKHSQYCNGGCMASAFRTWGDYSFPDPQRCAYFTFATQQAKIIEEIKKEQNNLIIRCDK